jgi:hypothetical protein
MRLRCTEVSEAGAMSVMVDDMDLLAPFWRGCVAPCCHPVDRMPKPKSGEFKFPHQRQGAGCCERVCKLPVAYVRTWPMPGFT